MAFRKIRVTRWRWTLAIVAVVAAPALIVAGNLRPVSHAATGVQLPTGVPFAGTLSTSASDAACSVTVVSEFMAITAAHCPTHNHTLKLNVASVSDPGNVHAVKEFRRHPTLDVKAIFLRERTGLTVTPLREAVTPDVFYTWGYGRDVSNRATGHLTRSEFRQPQSCEPAVTPIENGSLCWPTTAQNSVCVGDSGGPVTQDGGIIAMVAGGRANADNVGSADCGTTTSGQAIQISQMQPWLDEMIDDANPFPT